MENLKIKCFSTALLLMSVPMLYAQEIISLQDEMSNASQQKESVKKELLNQKEVFQSLGTGSIRSIIEKAKGQGCLYMTDVVVKGDINFVDLRFLAMLPAIEKLDLSGAKIVGDKYHSDNVYPSEVYEGLKSSIKEILLPEGLLAIDNAAFKDLVHLKKISIPVGCRVIGEKAFFNTASLDVVLFPEGLMFIEDAAFYGSGIKILSLPSSIKSIGRGAFQKSKLKYFSSEKVAKCAFINDRLLSDCGDLEYAYFHKNVRILGKKVFSGSSRLKEVVFASPLPPYLLDKSIRQLKNRVVIKVPSISLPYYKKKNVWRKLKKNYQAISNSDRLNIDTIYKERIKSLTGENTVTNYKIVQPKMQNEVQQIDVLKEMGFGESQSKQDISTKSLPLTNNTQEHEILKEARKPNKDDYQSATSEISKVQSEPALPSGENTVPLINSPTLPDLKLFQSEEKVEEIAIEQILEPVPTKVYWVTGKLYVESTRQIKVVNLMTVDGLYIYGKEESDTIWSFRIDASKVASVRVSYIDSDQPEIIKMDQ